MNTTSKKPAYKAVYRVTDIGIHGFFEEHRFLSNFHLAPIWFENREYPSTENAYQSAKFPDKLRQQFQTCTPNEAKKLGQTLKMNRDQIYKWDQKKLDVMREVCEAKFKHKAEREMLLATGDKYLEETNYWNDGYWGVCKRHGLNHLGRILMDIRNGIRLEQEM